MKTPEIKVDRRGVLKTERRPEQYHPADKLARGPDILKSSTYTTRNNFSLSWKKQEGQLGMTLKPALITALLQCFSQNVPEPGCP